MLKLLVMYILLTPLTLNPFTPRRNALERDMKASVLLRMKTIQDGNRSFGGCSGTYIGPYTILTAAHCFESAGLTRTWARGVNESLGVPARLVALDKRKDLALLDVAYRHSYTRIGKMPKRGDRVLNIGSPINFEFIPSEGRIGQTEYGIKGFTARYLVTTAMCNPGSSGGGAFNERGDLIGVNTMVVGMFGWIGITMAVNTDTVNEFLSSAFKYYRHELGPSEI